MEDNQCGQEHVQKLSFGLGGVVGEPTSLPLFGLFHFYNLCMPTEIQRVCETDTPQTRTPHTHHTHWVPEPIPSHTELGVCVCTLQDIGHEKRKC